MRSPKRNHLKPERAYVTPYSTLLLQNSHGGVARCTPRNITGPIFPLFLEAELSTYKGFRSFIHDLGIAGLTYLDGDSELRDFPLWAELQRMVGLSDPYIEAGLKDYDKDKPMKRPEGLTNSYIEMIYTRIRSQLLQDQENVRLFHQWYVKNHRPAMKMWPTISLWTAENYTGKTREENEFVRLARALYKHLSEFVTLKAEPEPVWISIEETRPRDVVQCVSKFRRFYEYGSFPARCYMEMMDMIEDGKTVKKCVHCHKFFVPSRKGEAYCNRVAPQYSPFEVEPNKSRTCKEIGRSKKHEATHREYRKQYKRFKGRLSYLQKLPNRQTEYRRVLREFTQWKAQEKEAKHGKTRRSK